MMNNRAVSLLIEDEERWVPPVNQHRDGSSGQFDAVRPSFLVLKGQAASAPRPVDLLPWA